MDDFVFSSSFNLANMTCQLVELGSLTLFLPYFYQLERQICKIEAAKSRDGMTNVIITISYWIWS